MSAKREDLEVMRCVGCSTVKAWRDGFPNRIYALCWECSWDRHVENAHGWQAWRARRKATRRAKTQRYLERPTEGYRATTRRPHSGRLMRHDQLCERNTGLATYLGSGCKCATRAYAADPLPDDVTPIYAEPKTPGQEGG